MKTLESMPKFAFLKFVPLVLALSSVAPAIAGTKDGGGGKGILCIGDHGVALRTLDLYEAETVYGLKLTDSFSNRDAILAEYGLRLGEHLDRTLAPMENQYGRKRVAKRIAKFLKNEILSAFRYLPDGEKLPDTADATLPTLPSGCEFVQIAIQNGWKEILVDRVFWEMLSPVDQAALILHEYAYRWARQSGATVSDDVRRIVGLLLSDRRLETVYRPADSEKILACRAYVDAPGRGQQVLESFEAIDSVEERTSGVRIYFYDLGREMNLARASVFISGVSTRSIFTPDAGPIRAVFWQQVFDRKWHFETSLDPASSQIRVRTWKEGEAAPDFALTKCSMN